MKSLTEHSTETLYYVVFSNDHTKTRSRTDIAAQILQAASESITRTSAMYNAFVSYNQLKEYLENLTENGLLEYDRQLQTYRTTEKGLMFVRAYHDPEKHLIKIPQ